MNKEFGGAEVSIHLASQPPLRGDGKLASQLVLLTIPTLNLFIADVTRIAPRVAPHEQGWFRVDVSRPCDKKIARTGHGAVLARPTRVHRLVLTRRGESGCFS